MQGTKIRRELRAVGDLITHSVGAVEIRLHWVRQNVFNVSVWRGVTRVDEHGDSFPAEDDARALARGLAQMFAAEVPA